jgi:flagellar biosynthesis/type III secretory pathway M-ring protein FliF/YscJ
VIENFWLNALYSVTPTILIGLVFWFIMRSILSADRGERQAYADIEEQERAKRGLGAEETPTL